MTDLVFTENCWYYSDMVEIVRNEVVLSTELISGNVLDNDSYHVDEDMVHVEKGLHRVRNLINKRLSVNKTNEKLIDLLDSYDWLKLFFKDENMMSKENMLMMGDS